MSRTFCEICGSPLTFKSTAFEGMIAVSKSPRLFSLIKGPGRGKSTLAKELIACVNVVTGNIPDFASVPFGMEVFTKDRWMIPAMEGAVQFEGPPTM